jgi:Ca-activated chloride channel family protein
VDKGKRADALALAMKNFDALQETAAEARPTSDRPGWGLVRGVKQMFANTTRGMLTATTALAALGLIAVIPVLQDAGPLPPAVIQTEAEPLAPVMEPMIIAEEAATDSLMAEPMIAMDAAPAAGATAKRSLSAQAPIVRPLPAPDMVILPEGDTEAFANADHNPLKVTSQDPLSTFSVDVDTASWSVIRNALTRGMLPPRDAVRIEEMVNYFPYAYPAPEGRAFGTSVGVVDSPWREGTQLVHIGLQGALPTERPPLNLVFLIDTSGSMDQPNKLPLLKQSFRLMLGQLDAQDSIAIVTYAGSAGRVLDPTPASDRATILAALDRLQAGGGTNGQEGLQQAYATAAEMAEEGEVSRVVLATDGDFNIGISDPEALEDYIATQRDSGTYLSVLGFGRGNLDDATMQALAQTGNGMAAYIDTLSEAQKVLVDQLQGTLVPIADDVKIQVEWNPAAVAEYRLISYETRALRREDFNNDRVDAGEIGAGHQVTAIYEITPVGSPARLTDSLRYGASEVAGGSDELGFLRLRYKAPGATESQLIETPINKAPAPLPDAGFAMAIAGFGQILRGSDLIGDWSMADAIALAQENRGEDPFGYRQEAITLMRLAQSLMAQ